MGPRSRAPDRAARGSAPGDADLRAEVEALLAADAVPNTLLERGAAATPPIDGYADLGLRVGPFEVVGLLGAGGMGAVYLAERVDGQFEPLSMANQGCQHGAAGAAADAGIGC